MVIFTKKLGQLKQWTGEKFGSTGKTEKPAEIKNLQNETKSRFDGIGNIRDSLNVFMKSLDESRNSALGELARAISAQSNFHGGNEFGTLLVTFGDGISKLSDHQNSFANEIRVGLLMSLDALLNETKEFERLRKKLKNRRLDYDANNNKLQKNKKEDVVLEENVKTTKMKYEETLHKLEEMMVSVSKQETELIDPFINFMESQMDYYQNCLKTSESILRILKEGKSDLKSIDFVAASFRRELEDDEYWLNSQDDSEEELPSNAVVSEEDSAVSRNCEEKSEESTMVRANYNFVAEGEKELSLKKGDIIKVEKRIDEGWWIGTCHGKSGMFPSNYVSIIRGNESDNDNYESPKKNTLISESNDIIEDSKAGQTLQKPGFSYLPQGAPISFIGKSQRQRDNENEVNTIANCGHCACEDFSANVFKPGHCNNCFHKH